MESQIKKFKLRARGQKKYFTVMVYEDLSQLRKDANKFDLMRGQAPQNDDAIGVCQPFEKTKIFSDGREEKSDNIGIIRLYSRRSGGSVVAHEIIHAALWQYRLTTPNETASFGKECGPKEEDFAHTYDRLFHDMTAKMYKHNLWNAQ